jgi:hypothetical protein
LHIAHRLHNNAGDAVEETLAKLLESSLHAILCRCRRTRCVYLSFTLEVIIHR